MEVQSQVSINRDKMVLLFFRLRTSKTRLKDFVKKLYKTADMVQYMSRLMGKPTICIGENKDADQLRGNREADQRLCFHYSDSTIPLLLKSEISSF